ncbi:MAG: signal recognition particle receptor subunit alpha, partial [Deltaproteobacteria bacterium]
MMFDSLTERLQGVMQGLRGHGKLTAEDIDAAMREIRLALLEADVNFKVVREFVAHVKDRALGSEVMESLTPAQQVVKIVNEELVALMGSGDSKLAFSGHPPTVVLMAGLQGSGKTTTCAKLARLLKKDGKQPVLIAADVYRPAAIDQLQTLAGRVGVPC